MTAYAEVRRTLEQRVLDVFGTTPVVPVLMGTQDDSQISKGSNPYLRVTVRFMEDRQKELGRRDADSFHARRVRGFLLIFIHTRIGTGAADADQIQSRISRQFAARAVGRVILGTASVVSSSRTSHWDMTGIRVDFHFDYHESTTPP